MTRQFCNDIWDESGEKHTWTGEQEIRERGKLRGNELKNQVIQELQKTIRMREAEYVASLKEIRSIRKNFNLKN
jgi:hypothetical protein